MSLGAEASCNQTIQSAINSARANGTVIVVAAGNSSDDASDFLPAGCEGVVTVAAMDSDGNKSSFSNYGDSVDIAAPGREILSTLNAGSVFPGSDNYVLYNGTSMATPHVAGVAALILSVYPNFTPDQVEQHLKDSSRAFVSGSSCEGECGSGMVDAQQAVDSGNIGAQKAKFSFDCDLLACDFTALSANDSSVVDWSWSLGDGSSMNGSSFSYEFAEEGDYQVELTITDDEGSEYSTVQTVSVIAAPVITIELTYSKTSFLFFFSRLQLSWKGATSEYIDIYKNDVFEARDENSGGTDYLFAISSSDLNGNYKVCEKGTDVCSNVVVVQ